MAEIKGGEKLKAALEKLSAKVKRGATLKVGFMSDAVYPDGTPVAMIAAIQNFGAPAAGIPPRPFFSNMVAEKQGGWPKALGLALKANDYDGEAALNTVGEGMRDQLVDSIVNGSYAPLSPVTIMLRSMFPMNPDEMTFADVLEARRRVAAGESPGAASTKPLDWTGHMISSVTKKVESTS